MIILPLLFKIMIDVIQVSLLYRRR